MKRRVFPIMIFSGILLLSGCTLADQKAADPTYSLGTILKTTDGGEKWESASKDAQGKTLLVPEILSLAIDPSDPSTLYAGTEKSGLFRSEDSGESWKKLEFPLTQIFGLAVSPGSQVVYASGIYKERAKIYKLQQGAKEWEEIYSEPANGATIYALEMDPANPDIVFAGTSEGMIFKTADGGGEWKNLTKASGPVNMISIDRGNRSLVYFTVFNQGLLLTKDGGENIIEVTDAVDEAEVGVSLLSVLADPTTSGNVYLGLSGGLIRGTGGGAEFKALNVLESSKQFPIRALAVNPRNGKEVLYGAGRVVYRSNDGGERWSTYQMDSVRTIFQLKYDPQEPRTAYLGLRKID